MAIVHTSKYQQTSENITMLKNIQLTINKTNEALNRCGTTMLTATTLDMEYVRQHARNPFYY